MYAMWAVAIAACLLIAVFALIFSSCSGGKAPAATPTPSAEVSPNTDASPTPAPNAGTPAPSATPAATSAELPETADAGTAFIDKLTFLGDSTTYGLKHYGVLSGGTETTQVWTPTSGTLALFNQAVATIVYPETGEEITIVDAVTRKKPEYLVITLGVNGVASMDEETFTKEYTKLVQSVQEASPDTKIICNSIYPVTAVCDAGSTGITNAKISTANGWIKQVAEDCGVKYWNTASAIADANGVMPDALCNNLAEGIHMNADGYNTALQYMRTHAYQ